MASAQWGYAPAVVRRQQQQQQSEPQSRGVWGLGDNGSVHRGLSCWAMGFRARHRRRGAHARPLMATHVLVCCACPWEPHCTRCTSTSHVIKDSHLSTLNPVLYHPMLLSARQLSMPGMMGALLRVCLRTACAVAHARIKLTATRSPVPQVSMPGMMDTVLNLGLNDACAAGLAARSGDERFAYDAYRRFLDMYGDVVMGISHHLFEQQLEGLKVGNGGRGGRGAWDGSLWGGGKRVGRGAGSRAGRVGGALWFFGVGCGFWAPRTGVEGRELGAAGK